MKKNILKSLEPQTKSLFRFKNSDTKTKRNGAAYFADNTTVTQDPTITTTIVVTI